MPRRTAIGFLAALFAVCVYRAVTQSIVCDEGITFELYLAGPAGAIFHHFDANHHFLNTIAMRLTTAILGISEISMRLPALAGAALYFAAVYRFSTRVFGSGWPLLLGVASLTLNPLILDFMVAARGYGMGLGLLMWALAILLEQIAGTERADPRQLAWAGASLALSVTANLIFAVPAVALAAIALWMLPARAPARPKAKSGGGSPPRLRLWFAGPIVTVGLLYLLLAPVEEMRPDHFYAGAATIQESLLSLAKSSFEHSGPLLAQSWLHVWALIAAGAIAPLVLIAGMVWAIRQKSRTLWLTAGPAVFSALLLVAMHALIGLQLPADRTGIYFLALTMAVLLALAAELPRRAGFIALGLAALITLSFAMEFNVRKFLVWDYDADTRSFAEYIGSHRAQRPDTEPVRVGGSWQFEPSLFFYATKHQWTWMELRRTPKPEAGCEFCVLLDQDREYIEKLGLRELVRGSVSGSHLAAPP